MKVAVCIISYRRPEGLKRLVDGLNRLTFHKCREVPSLKVIVVDNDSSGLACNFCDEARTSLNWSLECSVEPRRGIPYARNTAVARAVEEDMDFVAFIDDDEVPEPSWLDELLYVQRTWSADVVTGPALPHFTVPVAAWIERGKFFESSRNLTGQRIGWASSRNVLVRSELFKNMDKHFDERFPLLGGSDVEFFERADRAGYKIVWADEALVHEWIPKSRANLRWLLKKSYRYGNHYSLRRSEFEPSMAVRANLVAEAGKSIAGGLVDLLSHLPRSLTVGHRPLAEIRNFRSPIKVVRRIRLLKSLQRIGYGMGILLGTVGKRYEAYRQTTSV